MTWFGIALVVYLALGTLAIIYLVGEPRKPISPSSATFSLIVNGLIVWGVVTVGTLHR